MRRTRNDGTKVWHNPEVDTPARRRAQSGAQRVGDAAHDRRAQKEHRAALEALFSPRKDAERSDSDGNAKPPQAKAAGRIVLAPPPQTDPQAAERQRLLHKLLVADGRPQISKIANEFLRAGFAFPDEQDVHLQLLEHSDEDRVRSAIHALSTLLVGELPKRRAVLESRLRRIEEFAEDSSTREAAERLRRSVSGRAAPPVSRPS